MNKSLFLLQIYYPAFATVLLKQYKIKTFTNFCSKFALSLFFCEGSQNMNLKPTFKHTNVVATIIFKI